eukprot:14290661-Alexandrium_andersonii.AAC.1
MRGPADVRGADVRVECRPYRCCRTTAWGSAGDGVHRCAHRAYSLGWWQQQRVAVQCPGKRPGQTKLACVFEFTDPCMAR